jgi:predicted MFS family arabinose efflux permease
MDSTSIVTRNAFMGSRLLRTPLWAIFSLIPYILYRDLHATPLQIAVIVAIKPMSSLLSIYWSHSINQRKDLLRSNIILANVLSLLPFFLFPWIENVWFFIAASGWFMAFHRGVTPAWMEVLKLNLPNKSRERVFAYGTTVGYVGDALLPFLIGGLLDGYTQAWRWIFPLTAFIALLAFFLQIRLPVPEANVIQSTNPPLIPLSKRLMDPWKNAWALIKRRPDFRSFQVGFMFGGMGLMVMQPALPEFFLDNLSLSYKELAIALAFCKGVGVASTSRIWADWMNKIDIYRFSAWISLIAALFPLCLIAAQLNLAWLYIAYIIWGIMQGGSELSWNLSGPVFSKEEDSSSYSSVGVLAVGLRGCFVPTLAGALCSYCSPILVLCLGSVLCLCAVERMFAYHRAYAKPEMAEKPSGV